jgi:hypothetical protein
MVALEMIAEVALTSGTSLWRHSDLIVSTKRSATAFRLALRWQPEALDAGGAEDRAERLGEQRVAVMDQVALASQKPIDVVG